VIHEFTRFIYLFVLIINRSLDYASLDAYFPLEKGPINTIFLLHYPFMEFLGSLDLMTPETLATMPTEYLM
jgi:hypothetical protein